MFLDLHGFCIVFHVFRAPGLRALKSAEMSCDTCMLPHKEVVCSRFGGLEAWKLGSLTVCKFECLEVFEMLDVRKFASLKVGECGCLEVWSWKNGRLNVWRFASLC